MTSFRWIVPTQVTGAVTGVLATILIAGCGGPTGPNTAISTAPATSPAVSATATSASVPSPSTGAPSASPAPAADHNAADIEFGRMVIPHHLQVIAMADLALTRAGDPWVRDLAGQIRQARDPEIRTAKGWLDRWGEEPLPRDHRMPGTLSASELDTLARADGPKFDRLFVTMMVKHHRGLIEIAEHEQAEGVFAEATTLAGSLITAYQDEIKQLRQYRAKLT